MNIVTKELIEAKCGGANIFMVRITFYSVQNDQGQELLEQYVRPLCARLNVELEVAPPGVDRGHSLARQFVPGLLILWDGSVEPGHVYHAMSDWVKHTKKHTIISRTPLPRNVLTRYQCAPIHEEHFENAALHEWLERRLYRLLVSNADEGQDTLSSLHFNNATLADHYWLFDHPADIFVSYRGSQQQQVATWKDLTQTRTGQRVRIVPQRQYAYETECVTRQQMWEVVACLFRELYATRKRVVFQSEDYYSSFWTCSELLSLIRWSHNSRDHTIPYTSLVSNSADIEGHPLEVETAASPIPRPTRQQANRLWRILNNSDPMISAPDTRISPSSFAKGLAKLVAPFGYYQPEFTGPDFWEMVRVPCSYCRPLGRKPEEIDWDAHLAFADEKTVDYYGYFSVSSEELQADNVRCPSCLRRIRLKNVRPPRTLWVPIMTTEKDQNRPVIVEQPLWEVDG